MFDKIINLPFGSISYCANEESAFWNQALVNQELNQQQLKLIETTLKKLKRQPAVYFENRNSLKPLIKFLLKHNYQHYFEDCWLFHPGRKINTEQFDNVKKVLTERELGIFLKTFDACFQKDDPQNPYGELGDYLKMAEKVWHRHQATNRVEYFTVYSKAEPVGVSTLTNFKQIGYISNVGSLRKVRGQGFGKLATEDGTYPHEFYQRIGFVKKFSAVCYLKK